MQSCLQTREVVPGTFRIQSLNCLHSQLGLKATAVDWQGKFNGFYSYVITLSSQDIWTPYWTTDRHGLDRLCLLSLPSVPSKHGWVSSPGCAMAPDCRTNREINSLCLTNLLTGRPPLLKVGISSSQALGQLMAMS